MIKMPVEANNNSTTVFQKHCEKSIEKLSSESSEIFEKATDEFARTKILYQPARDIPVTIKEKNGKCYEAAKQYKTEGNAYFAKKDYGDALETYNNGIIICPQDSDDARELLSILISNRSATYYELGEYKKVFTDIDYITEIGSYPKHLQYKIWLRKAKCYDALQNEQYSEEAYAHVFQCLQDSDMDEKAIEAKIKEIENSRKNKTISPPNREIALYSNPDIFVGGNEYISAHPKISFQEDSYQGRYAVATDHIPVGTIIVQERSHCAVIDSNHALTNCQHCFTSVDQPIACHGCNSVVFCSTLCERLANKSYHRVECPVLSTLFESGASVNCLLALRIISQTHYSNFNDKRNKLKDYLSDDCKKSIIRKKCYRFDDYDNVFFLCRNEHLNKTDELIRFSVMANFLLRLLKYGRYFPFETDDAVLEDKELFIGTLLFRHLQQLRFNAHEISELTNPPKPINVRGLISNYENVTIGAGLYPTLALFNHSCDPSIVRYNIKNSIVVRTIKPVKPGDIIYENYGPLYMAMPLEKRKEVLNNNYWFECLCAPCTELWPTFDDMVDGVMRIACATERCPFVFDVGIDDGPFLTCSYCHRVTTILGHIQALMALDKVLPEAERLYRKGLYDKAMREFIKGLDILYKYLMPPHPDIIKVQQRVRVCMVHMGNTSCNFKFKE